MCSSCSRSIWIHRAYIFVLYLVDCLIRYLLHSLASSSSSSSSSNDMRYQIPCAKDTGRGPLGVGRPMPIGVTPARISGDIYEHK